VEVPEQLSVVGIDDLAIAEYGPVPLTTIRVPTTELGREGGRLVLDLLGGGAEAELVLPPELVVRKSAAPPRPPLTLSGGHD
jgi:DNA-binding LacI/PurR family transcriptional regulator